MKKEYLKPDVEVISLMPKEEIASNDDLIDGEPGVESSVFPIN